MIKEPNISVCDKERMIDMGYIFHDNIENRLQRNLDVIAYHYKLSFLSQNQEDVRSSEKLYRRTVSRLMSIRNKLF